MIETIEWDSQLISRYDHPGPRYTSYPTAMQFHEGITSADVIQALHRSRELKRPLSLYIHIPFCAHICYYCACNKVITKDRSRAQPYLKAVIREAELISQHLSPEQVVHQLHFGGGTPTFLSHEELRHLMAQLRRIFNLLDDDSGDYSIEIDPREADWATMGLLRELGFNRASLGLQDLDSAVQHAVNRLQSLDETRAIVEAARTLQYRSINIDLIYGLPLQTPEKFKQTLSEVINLQPNRLSLFNYAHLPERFMPQRRIKSSDLPSPADKLTLLHNSINQLNAANYRYIGMDHFALPDDELACAQEDGTLHRNFQGYTTHGHCDLIGLGVSSISQIGDLYSQNSTDITAYQELQATNQLPTRRGYICDEDDRLRRSVIQQLICHFELSFGVVEHAYQINFKDYFASIWPALVTLSNDGLIALTTDSITVKPAGRLLIRSLCMLFDKHLSTHNQQKFSRII